MRRFVLALAVAVMMALLPGTASAQDLIIGGSGGGGDGCGGGSGGQELEQTPENRDRAEIGGGGFGGLCGDEFAGGGGSGGQLSRDFETRHIDQAGGGGGGGQTSDGGGSGGGGGGICEGTGGMGGSITCTPELHPTPDFPVL